MSTLDRNDEVSDDVSQKKLELVTPSISLMEAEDTRRSPL